MIGVERSADIESRLLNEINRARADPPAYAEELRRYRSYFDGRIVRMPNDPVGLLTEEGVVPVDEAIRFLSAQRPLPPLAASPLLSRAAADHVAQQGPAGRIGHDGLDGSNAGERARRRGGGSYVGEIISYGAGTAEAALRQFVVDDRVASRGHRLAVFSPTYQFAGIACGPHARHRVMCVVDLSTTADGRYRPAR
jgi:uncharacterized protein YkwD